MTAFHGPQRPGAAKDRKAQKRTEADDRNAKTKRPNRRQARLEREAAERAAREATP